MRTKKAAALFLALCLLAGLGLPAAQAENKVLHISTVNELQDFANKCSLDSYSVGLSVVLDNDLDMSGAEFYPVPTFSGSFDGGGHSIINLKTATDGSHQGFFRYIQAEGSVKNLHLEGSVTPDNSREQVGGLAGTNYGSIERCSFKGTVSGLSAVGGIAGENFGSIAYCETEGNVDGKRYTGGIVGYNEGLIDTCNNRALVNTTISETGLELDKIDLSNLTDLDLTSADDGDVVSDTGGIAGYSKGHIHNCANRGDVGYQHYGYNVGGIAGRQSGYTDACTNYAPVYGRKDVGGIVGQMEPFMQLKASASLAGELYTLNAMVTQAMARIGGVSDKLSLTLQDIKNNASSAVDKINGGSGGGDGLIELLPSPKPSTEPSPSPEPVPSAEPAPTEEPAPSAEPAPSEEPSTSAEPATSAEPEQDPVRAMPLAAVTPTDPGTGGGTDTGAGDGTGTGAGDGTDPGTGGDTGPGIGDGTVQLPDITLPDNIGSELEQMVGNMGALADFMGSSTGSLAEDLVAISNQLSRVIMLLGNALSGMDMTVIEDISDGLPENNTDGELFQCVNYGQIDGDDNVGGIAGAMGIEYEFDMEGTLSKTFGLGKLFSSTYQTKCVSEQNINKGSVTGKKDNIGGIIGLEELGTIRGCKGYGSVESAEGGYVGGICGYSQSSVRNCYAMCTLDGSEYVGGIAGYGTEISGCASLIGIGDVTACCGAIAGWADIKAEDAVKDNVFVHNSLGAVDGISYEGKAVPLSYEELLASPNIPEQFKKLRLIFSADGKTVREVEFEYGGSIDQQLIPEVPEKEGYSGAWPEYDYSKLYFSAVIEAVYTPRHAAIAAPNHREDSPMSLLLLEGDFEDGALVTLNGYSGEGPEAGEGQVLEKWVMRLDSPERNGSFTVRYLPPETQGRAELYALEDGQWTKLSTGRSGSYMTFTWSEDSLVFALVDTAEQSSAPAIAITAALLLAAAAAFLIIRRRKGKRPGAAALSAGGKDPADTVSD